MDTQYMEILERLKTRHLLTSSAVDSLAKTSALLEKAQELRAAVSSAKGSPRNRFFGSPTYRGNFHEYIRDGESDGIYPNPELSEALMSFPTSWTETSV